MSKDINAQVLSLLHYVLKAFVFHTFHTV